MKIKVYINEKPTTIEPYQICYEVYPNRFKSLRLSSGQYPSIEKLDYNDKEIKIKEDFLDEMNKSELKELLEILRIVELKNDDTLKNNWFGFKEDEKFDNIYQYIQKLIN